MKVNDWVIHKRDLGLGRVEIVDGGRVVRWVDIIRDDGNVRWAGVTPLREHELRPVQAGEYVQVRATVPYLSRQG
jgi:hypothetical protein